MIVRRLVEELRKRIEEERGELTYGRGVGITSLLYCPLKWEYRQKYPEIRVQNAEIDDGFTFELAMKRILKDLYGDRFVEEKELIYELNGFTIQGHLDGYIEEDDKVIGLEFKHTKFMKVLELSENLDLDDLDIIDACEIPVVLDIPEHYITQAKIQRFILEKTADKPVEHYLIIKTTLQKANGSKRMKKAYIQFPVNTAIRECELEELIERFQKVKEPRFSWECRYCPFSEVCKYHKEVCYGA